MFENWGKKKSIANDEIEFRSFEEIENEQANAIAAPATHEETLRMGEVSVAAEETRTSSIELKVVHPEAFSEVSSIADYLLDGCTVVLNLDKIDREQSLRMLDFLNGVTYANYGDIKQVAKTTYIITPNGIDISEST